MFKSGRLSFVVRVMAGIAVGVVLLHILNSNVLRKNGEDNEHGDGFSFLFFF